MDWTVAGGLYPGVDNDPENILASLDIDGYRMPVGSRVCGSTQEADIDSNEMERASLGSFRLGLQSDPLHEETRGVQYVGMEQQHEINNINHLQCRQDNCHTYSSLDSRDGKSVNLPPHTVDSVIDTLCDSMRSSLKPHLSSIRIPASEPNIADIRNNLKFLGEVFESSSVDMAAISKDIAAIWDTVRGRTGLYHRLSTVEGRQKALQSKTSQIDKLFGPKVEDWAAALKRHQSEDGVKNKEAQMSTAQATAMPSSKLCTENDVGNNKGGGGGGGGDHCNQQQQLLEERLQNMEVHWSALEKKLLSELKSNGDTVSLANARINLLQKQVRIAQDGIEKLTQTVMKMQRENERNLEDRIAFITCEVVARATKMILDHNEIGGE